MKGKKKKNGGTPRRKRMNQPTRLQAAKSWIPAYIGKNIVKGYAKWFGVELLCAIRELRLQGVAITGEYEQQVKRSVENRERQRKLLGEAGNKQQDSIDTDSDDEWACIAGYTSSGFPYGIRHNELTGVEPFTGNELGEDEAAQFEL